MVVGGEVVTLKAIEESSNLIIAEMPIHVILLFALYTLIFRLEASWVAWHLTIYIMTQHVAFEQSKEKTISFFILIYFNEYGRQYTKFILAMILSLFEVLIWLINLKW